jgi:carbon-monoxide dehydrogenase small subunit
LQLVASDRKSRRPIFRHYRDAAQNDFSATDENLIELRSQRRPTESNEKAARQKYERPEEDRMPAVKLTVNGKAVSGETEDRTLLVHFLRDHLGLTGTHVGCDTSQCGACVVHIDGRAVKSCTVLVGQADGANVTTIEGISKGDELHPMQAAFRDNHGLQCGFCTPGMIMSAIDIVKRHGGKLDEQTVRHELEGNLCRCTGYHNIVKSVLDAAGRMKVSQAAE